MQTIKPPSYMSQLDGLRAIAVGMVLMSHWTDFSWPLANGRVGVIIFFILSGFLITGILFEAREQAELTDTRLSGVIKRFYIRRFLRIFPLFYLVLIAAYLLGFSDVKDYFAWYALYIPNILFTIKGDWLGSAAPLWSLAVEEQFYLLWPLVILLVPKRWTLPAIIGCIVTAPLSRVSLHLLGANEYAYWTLPFCVMDSLCIGALLAYLKRYVLPNKPELRVKIYDTSLISFTVFVLFYYYLLSNGWNDITWNLPSDTLTSLIMAGLIFQASSGFPGLIGWLLSSPILTYLGKISYGLYVFHGFVPELFWKIIARFNIPYDGASPGITVAIYFVLTLALSVLSWHFFESRINALKKYVPYIPPSPSEQKRVTTPRTV